MRAGISAVLGYLLACCLKFVLYATFVPLSEETYSIPSELAKEAVTLVDVWVMYRVLEWKWGRVQDQRARALGLGFGWALADAVLANFLIFALNAAGTEFTWTYIQRALSANFTIFEWVAFGYFVWLTARKDGSGKTLAWAFIALRILAPVLLHEVAASLGADQWVTLGLHGAFALVYALAAK